MLLSTPYMCSYVFLVAVLGIALVAQSKEVKPSYVKSEVLTPRIINGTAAGEGEFPWAMAIMKGGRVKGAAALITTKTALTAAHVFYKVELSDLRGKIGNILRNRGYTVHFVNATAPNGFDRTSSTNDIGILILKESVTLSETIKIIPLPRTDKQYQGTADIVGWGRVKEDTVEQPHNLQLVKMDIMDHAQCTRNFKNPLARKVIICTAAEKKGPYKGDSGTSLIYGEGSERISIGVLSGGGITRIIGEKSMFVSTGYYAKWIEDNADGEVTFLP